MRAARAGLTLLLLLVLLIAPPAGAQEHDARTAGVAGAGLPEWDLEARRRNPSTAALSTPLPVGTSFTVPVGLLQWAIESESFDPDDRDFDLVAVLDRFLSPPLAWNVRGESALGEPLALSRSSSSLFSADELDDLLDVDGAQIGRVRSLAGWRTRWNLGEKLGVATVRWARLYQVSALHLRPGPATRTLLDGATIVEDRRYGSHLDGHTELGVSTELSWARAFRLGGGGRATGEDWREQYWQSRDDAPVLAIGLTLRESLALLRDRYVGDLDFVGAGAGLRSRPRMVHQEWKLESVSDLATDASLDLGTTLRWRRLELGAGVADLFRTLTFEGGEVVEYEHDDTGGVTRRELDPKDAPRSEIPPSWRIDARWRGRSTRVALAWEGEVGGQSLRGGIDRAISGRWTLRGGLALDSRTRLQGAAGVGWTGASFGLGLGLRTHGGNLSGARDLAVGLNVLLLP